MKKDFIQKLSIAMASALVITSVAPAATAEAATMKMNKSSKILYLNADNSTDTGSDFDFNITNKGKDYKKKYTFKWSVSKDGIVDLNTKNGKVEAVGVGKTTVSCKVYKKSNKKLYKTIKATVEVKANAETVVINNQPTDGKMLVGTTFDFNRTIKNANGGKATDKTEWLLFANEELTEECKTATVDSQGVVTATDAGTFYVVARTYQSKATKDITTAKSEAIKVTVPVQLTDIRLTKATEVELTFDSSVKDILKTSTDAEIYTVTANKAKYLVKSVKVSEDGKKATVETYQRFTDGTTYSVKAAGTTKEFTAKIGKIASIVLENKVVPITTDGSKTLNNIGIFKVFDANGVDITTDFSVSATSLAVLSTYNSGSYVDADGKLYMMKHGDAVTIQLKYFQFNTTTGADESILSNTATITCADIVASSTATWAIADAGKSAYPEGTTTQTVNAGADNKQLYVKFKDNFGNELNNIKNADKFAFESYDNSILTVNREGRLYPQKAGTVTVKVTYGDYVDFLTVTVREKGVLGKIEVSKNTHSLSNSAYLATRDSVEITFKLKDIFGDNFNPGTTDNTAKIDTRYECKGVILSTNTLVFDSNGEAKVKFEVTPDAVAKKTTGQGQYQVTFGGKTASVLIYLKTPSGASKYRVEMNTSLDNYPQNSWEAWKGNTDVKLWNTDANDVLVSEATGASISYRIEKSDGSLLVDNAGKRYEGKLDGSAADSHVFKLVAANDLINPGTYTIKYFNKTNGVDYLMTSQSFTVTSSKKSANAVANKVDFKVDSLDVNTNLVSAFDYYVNGAKQWGGVTDVQFKYIIVDTGYIQDSAAQDNGTVSGGNINFASNKTEVRIIVKHVQFKVDGITYHVDLSQPITFKQN